MDESGGSTERELLAARALRELALEFADRAQEAEAALIAAFCDRAAVLSSDSGPIVISSDEDEHLVLRADGAVAGRVLDDDTDRWLTIGSPAEVARYYDPTDVFLDLAEALEERFPELAPASDGGRAEMGRADEDRADEGRADEDRAGEHRPDEDRAPDTPPAQPTETGGRATLAMLQDLRRAGVLSEAEFERLRSQLDA